MMQKVWLSVLILSVSAFQLELREERTQSYFTNPVQYQRDSPDPGVTKIGKMYIAVTTMGWTPAADQYEINLRRIETDNIRPLTDCSTCHR